MELIVSLNSNTIQLKILKNRVAVDLQTAKYYHNLSEVLITTLDMLFKRTRIDPVRHFRHNGGKSSKKAMSNGVDTTALKSFKIKGNLGTDSTSHKITQAFIEGLKVSC